MRIHKKTLKFKFAVVTMGKPHFIMDSPEYCMDLADFRIHPNQSKCSNKKDTNKKKYIHSYTHINTNVKVLIENIKIGEVANNFTVKTLN